MTKAKESCGRKIRIATLVTVFSVALFSFVNAGESIEEKSV
jgi:hypothetical protein